MAIARPVVTVARTCRVFATHIFKKDPPGRRDHATSAHSFTHEVNGRSIWSNYPMIVPRLRLATDLGTVDDAGRSQRAARPRGGRVLGVQAHGLEQSGVEVMSFKGPC